VSRVGVARLLSRLERRGKGLLGALRLHFAGQKNVLEGASYELIDERMLPSLAASHRLVTDVFDLLAQHLRQHNSSAVRLTPEFGEDQLWRDGLGRSLDDLLRELKLLSDALDLLRERITASDTGEEDPPIVAELRGVARRLGSAGDALHTALRPAHEEAPSVRWIESRGSDQNVMAATVPLDLSHILRRDLFRRVKTAVVTSATLSTNGSFDFVRGRLGLTAEDVEPRSAIFPSAFHFEDQSLLAVPLDFPIPSEEPEEHRSATVGAIADLCGESDGGIFVLCTSHKDVRAIASALRQGDMASQRPLLVHGEEESRDMMLRRFRDSGRAILVGTTSFWEGVDVRGNALRGLVITRLPFRVPTEPITAAQCEAIAAAGGDPFTDYLLPHAALRLKQGFGRLIRSSTDWGAVLIADPRVVLRNYGEVLIESLPPARRVFAPWVGVRAALRKFYQQRRG
jgi:ATP-dependent DNA helicase DinG